MRPQPGEDAEALLGGRKPWPLERPLVGRQWPGQARFWKHMTFPV